MRSFPFLADEAPAGRLEALTGLDDPAPGELVWWHENLVAALDASGFCAFSAAGLLADGVCDLDSLAGWLGHRDGDALIGAGASIVLLRRAVEERFGVAPDRDRPAALATELDRPGMLDAYRAARGIDAEGRPLAKVWGQLAGPELTRPVARLAPGRWVRARQPSPASRGAGETVSAGRVRVATYASGPLAELCGLPDEVELYAPATVELLLERLVERSPDARRFVGAPGAPLLNVWCRGRRLRSTDPLGPGDRVDLVLAIAGG